MRDDAPWQRAREDPDVLHRGAQAAILARLATGEDDAAELMDSVAPFDVRGHVTPDVAMLEIAATALGLACPPGNQPLEYEGLTERYLPDRRPSDRTSRHRTQYAVYAAACIRGGLLPDLLREAGGWQPRLWTYAVSAVVLYTRAAADRLGLSRPQIAAAIATERGLESPVAP